MQPACPPGQRSEFSEGFCVDRSTVHLSLFRQPSMDYQAHHLVRRHVPPCVLHDAQHDAKTWPQPHGRPRPQIVMGMVNIVDRLRATDTKTGLMASDDHRRPLKTDAPAPCQRRATGKLQQCVRSVPAFRAKRGPAFHPYGYEAMPPAGRSLQSAPCSSLSHPADAERLPSWRYGCCHWVACGSQ